MAIRILLSRRLGDVRWTQADLARSTGIRAATINDLYHDMAERVSLEHLDLICEALQCDLHDLLIYTPNQERRVNGRIGFPLTDRSIQQHPILQVSRMLRQLTEAIEMGVVPIDDGHERL